MEFLYIIYYFAIVFFVIYEFWQYKNQKLSIYIKSSVEKVNDSKFYKLQFQTSIIAAIASAAVYSVVFYILRESKIMGYGVVILVLVFYFLRQSAVFIGERRKYIN